MTANSIGIRKRKKGGREEKKENMRIFFNFTKTVLIIFILKEEASLTLFYSPNKDMIFGV